MGVCYNGKMLGSGSACVQWNAADIGDTKVLWSNIKVALKISLLTWETEPVRVRSKQLKRWTKGYSAPRKHQTANPDFRYIISRYSIIIELDDEPHWTKIQQLFW